MQRATALLLILVMLASTVLLTAHAQDKELPPASPWPQDVTAPKGAKITVYQPQPESFEGVKITGRAAVSVVPPGETEPKFGAIWLEARIAADRDAGLVDLVELKIPKVRFPEATEAQQKNLVALLEKEMPKWAPQIDIDRLTSSLDTAKVRKKEAKNLKTDAPTIVFVTEPTELVILEGQPALRPVENTKLMKVINTNFFIVLDANSKKYFMNLGKVWMTAPDVMKGPWTQAKSVPAEIVKIAPKQEPEAAKEDEGIVPKVMVVNGATTELITSDGQPKYTPLSGGDLLFISNTDGSVLLEIGTQLHYVLVSGRWYSGKGLKGPWTYVKPDALPKSFQKIPPDSEIGDVRASVAGTDEAKDAVMDAQIPQTATIKRVKPDLKVTYDGDPKYVKIEGTTLSYGKNTKYTVIQDTSGDLPRFYCCHEGVWYEGPGPTGPWTVAIKIPASIYSIPPSCPCYNVTYVRIYGYTPEVVYVGYYPGYYGGYVYNGTVVYGTGYTYVVWVGVVYYPRPVTYGWGWRYSPLGRWFSPWSIGGVVRRTRRRTRRRHHHHYHRNRHHHRSRNAYNRNRHSNRHRSSTANRNKANANRNRSSGRKNNHQANKNGNVSRRNNNGSYQSRNKNGWSNSSKGSKSQNRQSSNRSRGSSRSSSRSRGGGGRRR